MRLFLLLFCLPLAVLAQDSLRRPPAQMVPSVLLRLNDGTTLRGTIVQEDSVNVVLRTDNLGNVTLNKAQIAARETGDGYYSRGQFWFRNPHRTRYFFAPSAINLQKGEGYYQNTYVFLNSVNYGLTDHFTIGGGFFLNPVFSGDQLLFLTPKLNFRLSERAWASLGTIMAMTFVRTYTYGGPPNYVAESRREMRVSGIAFGNVTLGTTESNTTFGLGMGYSRDGLASVPSFNISHMSRIGRRLMFVTENWLVGIPSESAAGILSGGLRIMGERTSVDLGLLSPVGSGGDFIVLPYLNFVARFGKRQLTFR